VNAKFSVGSVGFMKRIAAVARFVFCLGVAGGFGGCAVFHEDAPTSFLKVRAASRMEVESALTAAVTSRGFHPVGEAGREMTFERPATRTGEVLYGNWGEEKSVERLVSRIERGNGDEFRVSLFPYTIRGQGTGMEDVSRRLEVHSREYSKILKEVKAELRGSVE
jgi:hypothetical protein